MRELKFRAWDIDKKEYISDFNISDNGVVWTQKHIDYDPEYPNCIVELPTGLKDKNGKEIYEGDIVREVIDANLEEIDGEYEYIVQWSNEFKQLVLQTTSKNKMFFHDELYQLNMSREIIGNIHENPELLEK